MPIPKIVRDLDNSPAALAIMAAVEGEQTKHQKGKRKKHFQVLRSHADDATPDLALPPAKIPADRKALRAQGAEMVVSVADGVDAKGRPKSRTARVPDPNLADVLTAAGIDPDVPFAYSCDEYEGPLGVGFVHVFTTVYGGKTYQRRIAKGPERDAFAHPWREVVPFVVPE